MKKTAGDQPGEEGLPRGFEEKIRATVSKAHEALD